MYDLFHQPEPTSKDLAIEASYQATTDQWKEKAMKLLMEFATYGKEFITEDFRLWLNGKLEQPKELRAFGGLMVRAKKAGLIKSTGKYTTMKSEHSHSCPKIIWIGLVKPQS